MISVLFQVSDSQKWMFASAARRGSDVLNMTSYVLNKWEIFISFIKIDSEQWVISH